MKKHFSFAMMALMSIAIFSGCKKDETPDDENELITTVQLCFNPVSGGDVLVYEWNNLSGTPEIDSILLDASTDYSIEISFFDESKTPVDDITEEIADEDDEHQIFYILNPASLANITVLDEDENGLPVGLAANVSTGSTAGNGTLRVVLKHAPGTKDGNLATGSTDVDVIFPISIR